MLHFLMSNPIFLTSLLVKFTESQSAALKHFEEFESDASPNKCFVLKGYAGTGKTTMVSFLVQKYKSERKKIKLLAPTGRAAKVMSHYAKFPAATIHKQIYYLNDVLEGKGLSKAKNMFHDTLFVVDEASMVGIDHLGKEGDLLNDLLDYVYCGQGCSLVLVGDPGQLPPVGQTNSPALSPEYLGQCYQSLKIYVYTLKEVVRQASSSQIIQNATFLRLPSTKQTPFFQDIGCDVIRTSGIDLMEHLQSIPSNEMNSFVVLTLSNKRADRWNQEIRKTLFGYDEFIERGELLMVVKNNYHWAADREMGFIANGEMLKVERVVKEEECFGFSFIHLIAANPEGEEFSLICFKDTVNSGLPNMPREHQRQLFFEIEKDYIHEKNKKKRYQLILKNPHFNALQIKYAYAVTAHKAQGGQWKHVFIDYSFLPENMETRGYLQWLYTCMTRATDKVYLVNFPDHYFG
ncbi:MAG: AAA family ATPase [Bacteroidetes bacterium]|nr:AAA family ATPase [Bacteroidota bacterium]MBM3424473.1 ATP-dependent endonuclease [Bacteroidota bacterium]